MTDIRRTVLWVVFTMSLVLLWDGWQKHNGHPSMFSPPAAKPVAAAGSAAQPGVPAAAGLAVGATAVPGAPVATRSEKLNISTDVMTITLDTQGGDVTHVELPKYLASPEPGLFDPLLQAVGLKDKPKVEPKPIVLMDAAAQSYKAQTGLVGTRGEQLPTHNTLMTVTTPERKLADGANELLVRLESAEVGGVVYVKTYSFKRGDYVIGVKHEVINKGAAPLTPQVYVQLVRDGVAGPGGTAFTGTFTGPAIYNDKNKFQKFEFKDIEKGKTDHDKTANDGWVAMVQHYFASAWLHNEAVPREFFVNKVKGAAPEQYAVGMVFTLPQLAPGATATKLDQLFVGPQEENKLAALAPGLELVKDYGIFAILAKPLFWLLEKLHSILGNWGWAIIALVVLLKIAFYWLNASAYKSMAKMKAVGPKIQEMRERLKDKPQQMQQEMMKIYREEKVNPIGGCLPIFLQMPFFMGLYWVLLSTVEMRGAPWLGWITDLSVKDPYFILPLLMTASSLFQVWLNPTPPDPMQAKMMWIMPLAFSFMFFIFPSGLVLYWLVNNILSIAQQWYINKKLGVQN
ncbi:membrane protein insertase YidC [Paucibacter sp. DJ2R-2]|uniref:membrane protein insertase YidC n=1 Tax=Paucibacter sp. DJ2R-2 TaxID=2893558 RepID=UPI0021E427A5|nr:membrane protein insertase YidC [Paucibacter sp. DJ2R-2]MCV2419226.1 membrane protein insertase YidC [Paucibacter sp. DJ4R-1]MCV2437819.1 membrane protein insertase YidC [Paucibacter sp. DJ2R-2]